MKNNLVGNSYEKTTINPFFKRIKKYLFADIGNN
jgi:hypothetical protein